MGSNPPSRICETRALLIRPPCPVYVKSGTRDVKASEYRSIPIIDSSRKPMKLLVGMGIHIDLPLAMPV